MVKLDDRHLFKDLVKYYLPTIEDKIVRSEIKYICKYCCFHGK